MRYGSSGRRSRLAVGVLTAVALVATACGGSAGPTKAPAPTAPASGTTAAGGAPAKKVHNVTLQLPWLVAGYDTPFYLAQAKGYYKDAGLNVRIIPGRSSLLAAEIVSQGKATFGFADAGTAAQITSKGGDLKVLSSFTQKSPVGIMHMPGVPIKTARDLKGKTIYANSSGGPVIQLLKAVLVRAGLSMSDVHLVVVSPSSEASTFETHPKDLALSFSYSAYPAVLLHAPKAQFTYYADLGVNTLSLGIITTNKQIKAHPQEVKAFVDASLRGWRYTIGHQSAALALMHKLFPKENPFILKGSLDNALTLLHTPASKGKPLGWMAKSDWQSTVAVLHKFSTLKNVLPLDTYYTNKYVGGPQG